MIIRAANISFYLITLIWFLVSCIKISFTVRMSLSLIFLFMTIVLLWSVCHIKHLVSKKISAQVNTWRVNLNLVIFGLEFVNCGWLFFLTLCYGK